jgi:hypothetical protein
VHPSGRLWHALLAFTGDPEVASDALAEAFSRIVTSSPLATAT